jgi:hypothetical protein
MNELIKYFNKNYEKEYGKVSYPRTTIQIYRVYQAIKSYGINDNKLVELLHNVKLPKPRNTEEWELYVYCLYNMDDSELEEKIKDVPKKTIVENNKLYLAKNDGTKIDEGTALPAGETGGTPYDDTAIKADINALKTDLVVQNSISLERKEGSTIGGCSVAIGYETTASGNSSHAEGNNTTASGDYSHAEGYKTVASGSISHAEGNTATASGNYSHAEGNATTASGYNSHAEGHGTIAHGENQHAEGKYNIEDAKGKYAHIVGNGNSNNKSNAHTLDWKGNAWYAGKLSQEGTPTEDKDLVTKKYFDDGISSLPQISFNENGELVVTINGVSKIFVPKS